MDQKALFKQVIDFQKATFDNSFKAMATLQEQGEQIVNMFLEQAPWLPQEGKKAVADWINAYRKGREDFRDYVETNFEKVKDYFSGQQSPSE
jgi:hypothetical protein